MNIIWKYIFTGTTIIAILLANAAQIQAQQNLSSAQSEFLGKIVSIEKLDQPAIPESLPNDSSQIGDEGNTEANASAPLPIASTALQDRYAVTVDVETGPEAGETVEFVAEDIYGSILPLLSSGDRVILTRFEVAGEAVYNIVDFVRTPIIYTLAAILALLAVLVAGRKGLFSLLALTISFVIIFVFTLPAILNGLNALLISTLTVLALVPINFFLGHGFNRKTAIAATATIITLTLSFVVAAIVMEVAKLTGNPTDESSLLLSIQNQQLNLRALFLASVIIGSLGILDDITVAQTATTLQLKLAKPAIGFKELYQRAISVGQDHITSLINTLVLVYTSSALPLLLLFIQGSASFIVTINSEQITEEIIRMLVSSIGLIAAVPITTILASYIFAKIVDKKQLESLEHTNFHNH